jgi:rhodanese-related sulfurtransferase
MSQLPVKNVENHQIQHIIDVRTAGEYARESIAGTRNMPLALLHQSAQSLPKDAPIILSCRTGRRAAEAYQLLSQLGFGHLQILEGGLEAWKRAGRPIVTQGHRFSIMQQVQMIAGILILLGSLYKPLWFIAPVVGLGLLAAGITNTCLMATLLSKMPWNRMPGNSANHCSLS